MILFYKEKTNDYVRRSLRDLAVVFAGYTKSFAKLSNIRNDTQLSTVGGHN